MPAHRPWKTVRVQDIAANTQYALMGGSFDSDLASKNDVQVGIPVIRGHNMGARWIGGEFSFVTSQNVDALEANLARPGDVIFTQRGSLGRVAVVPPRAFDRYLISQDQVKLTVDPEKADSLFVYYVFQSPSQREHIRLHSVRTATAHANVGIFRDTPLLLPDAAEQRSITAILGGLDDKIELNWQIGDTLEKTARAIFRSWFVDFDPVRAKISGEPDESTCARFGLRRELLDLFPDSLRTTDAGDLPGGWNLSTLGEEVKRCGGFIQTGPFGSQLHASDYSSDGIPVVMPQDLTSRRVSTDRIARVPEATAARLARHRLLPGDIVYSRRGDVERHAIISKDEAGWICGTGCLLIRPGERWPSSVFLSFVLNQTATREWIVRHAVGATMPNLNTSILSGVPLLLPPTNLLRAFEEGTAPFFASKDALRAETESLAQIRDALIPELTSGRVRIANEGLP